MPKNGFESGSGATATAGRAGQQTLRSRFSSRRGGSRRYFQHTRNQREAQAQLGHADPRITLEIYTHMVSGTQREAVERFERFLLFPSCGGTASKMVN